MRPLVEAEARNRIRKVSLVPITVAVSALTEFGRNDATSVSVTTFAPTSSLCTHITAAASACSGDSEGAEQAAKAVGARD